MTTWHVWGDYIHTIPERIGDATRVPGHEEAAKRTAQARGFDFDYRSRNGFEPWAAVFVCQNSDAGAQAHAFASGGTVKGWALV